VGEGGGGTDLGEGGGGGGGFLNSGQKKWFVKEMKNGGKGKRWGGGMERGRERGGGENRKRERTRRGSSF